MCDRQDNEWSLSGTRKPKREPLDDAGTRCYVVTQKDPKGCDFLKTTQENAQTTGRESDRVTTLLGAGERDSTRDRLSRKSIAPHT